MADLQDMDFRIIRIKQSGTASDREFADIHLDEKGDLNTATGNDNLAQAVVNRLLTRKGELSWLGHTDYGSRLHELIGEPNTSLFRAKAELFIRESLLQEGRIEEITGIQFAPISRQSERNMLKVIIGVKSSEGEFNVDLDLPS